ncbi:hypothetical protein CPC08DRAFT_731317 [Agrocybe pediades]|nr:hypothetical protein CPC08DRAFT_731317 [Agrocybe pediades]
MSSNFQQPVNHVETIAYGVDVSPSTSASNSQFSFPTRPSSSLALHQQHHYSPQKPARTQPNPHPYAIKTTSTALLSRSSSTSSQSSLNGVPGEGHGNALYQEKHRYVPPSPSGSYREGSDSPMKETRHRYSRSLTDGPVPLPPPPWGHAHSKFPKTWTSQQLAVYLATDDTNTDEVVGYVRESGITSKAFMRFTDGGLTSLSENRKQPMLSTSRSLLQRALRGRILGPSSVVQLPTCATLSKQDTGLSLSGGGRAPIGFSPP